MKKKQYATESIGFRITPRARKRLDRLCDVNQRSQRELFETFINREFERLQDDPKARINP